MKRFLSLLVASYCVRLAAADSGASLEALIPRLAAEKAGDRYPAWMELQQMAAEASRPGAAAERAALSSLLAAKAADTSVPQPARMWILRQLENIGAGEAVAALTKTLQDPDAELRECARRALEKNSAPEASASLRAALAKGGDSAWESGLINALGTRRDAAAVGTIASRLGNKELRGAAARALAQIGTAQSIEPLWAQAAQPEVAEALVTAGHNLLAHQQKGAAKDLFKRLGEPGFPLAARAAALYGLAKADFAAASPALASALTGAEPKLSQAAVAGFVAFSDAGVMSTIEPLWSKLTPATQAAFLSSLRSLPEKLALSSAGSADAGVRLAAIDALGRVGGAESVAVLAKLATEDGPDKTAAVAALARLSQAEALQALNRLADGGETRLRVPAIAALASRRSQDFAAKCLAYAQEPTPEIQKAGLTALGQYGSDTEVAPLARLARQDPSTDRLEALEAVCARVKKKEAAADTLLEVLNLAEEKLVAKFLPTFSVLGGARGANLVASMVRSERPEVAEIAIRALANWPDYPVADGLLKIAANTNGVELHHVLALQGVARLARASETEPAENRADLVAAALGVARRVEEKRLLLAALAEVPHAKSVQTIRSYLTNADLKADAASAGVSLAMSLSRSNRALARELAQAVKDANVSPETVRRVQRLLQ